MKTLLLVDDSRTVRLVGRRILSPLGFNLLEAENGQEALEVFRNNREIEVILLDWNMPVMDGLSFLRILRAEFGHDHPRVVMCTTENDMCRIVEAMEAGANEYIMKPFTEEIIRERLETVGAI